MDLLKEEYGTTIIESLVVILLLGILVTLTASFFSAIYYDKNMLKGQALQLANQEISLVLNNHSENDSIYTNDTGNLQVHRIIRREEKLNMVEVQVIKTRTDSIIVSLEASYLK